MSFLAARRGRADGIPVVGARAVRRGGAVATAFAVAVAGARVGFEVAVIILRFDVGDVKEAVAADREVNERGLDRRLEVDDLSFVDIPGIALETGAFDIKLLEDAIFDDGDTAFLGLEHVDEHFFLHAGVFLRRFGGRWSG